MSIKAYERWQKGLAVLGVLSGAATLFTEIFDGFGDRRYRWGLWIAAAALLWLSFVVDRSRESRAVDPSGRRLTVPNPWRQHTLFLALFFTAAFAADIYVFWRQLPLEYQTIKVVFGNLEGYTKPATDNVLVSNDVQALTMNTTAELFKDYPWGGSSIETMIQRRPKCEFLVIHSMNVRVTRFAPLPDCRMRGVYGAGSPNITGGVFLKNNEGHKLPWIFYAEWLSVNGGDQVPSDRALPYMIDDFVPLSLRYCISARDRGVYWIEPLVVVSDGVGPKHEISLCDKPLPIGFCSEADLIPDPSDIDELMILRGNDKTWIPWPPISASERESRIEMIMEQGKNKAANPPAPADQIQIFAPGAPSAIQQPAAPLE